MQAVLQSDSLIASLVAQMKSIAQRNYLQPDDAIQALQQPAFETFLSKVNMGVALIAPQGHFFFISQSFCKMLGYSREFAYSKGPTLLQQITTAHDRPLVDQLLQKSEEALRNISFTVPYPRISFDFNILSGDGELKRVYQHVMPNAVTHNKSFYTLCILHDFTGFKKSPVLSYRLSYLSTEETFVTLSTGQAVTPCPYLLTKSEKELLNGLAEGRTMKDMADKKSISLQTLKKHRSNLLKKTQADNMISLLKEFLINGWITLRNN